MIKRLKTSTIAGLVEFISKRYIEVLPYMVDELNYPLSLSSNDSPLMVMVQIN